MATKSNKKTKDNKNLIIGICAAVVLVVVIIVTIVLVVNNNSLNDSYFVSDDTKYVLTIENDESSEGDEATPVKSHIVYTYEGDKITSMKSYSEFADEATAKKAFDAMIEAGGEEAKGIELKGKYIIATAEEDVYKDLTANDVKQQIEFMESLKNMNLDDNSDTEEESEEVIENED